MAKRNSPTVEPAPEQCHVLIIRDSDGHIESNMGPHPERRAERIANGAGINLNFEDYTIEIVAVSNLQPYLDRSAAAKA